MSPNILFLISGAAFLVCLLAILDLSRLVRKRSGEWQRLAVEAESETSPLMEEEEPGKPETAAAGARIKKISLPRAPEITDHVITHTDWDGIFSGALLKYFSPLAKLEVTTPRRLKNQLRGLARSADKPQRLFITDLGIESADLPSIESSLIDIKRRGAKIYWYDHHPWVALSVDTARRDCDDIIVDSTYRNAAEIIHDRLLAGDEYAGQLIRLLVNQLKPDEGEWGQNWRRLIASTQSSGSFVDITDLIADLAANRPFTVNDRFQINRMAEEETLYERFARGKHREEVTRGKLKLLVVDLRTFRMDYDQQGRLKRKFDRHSPPSSIGHEIVRFHQPDIYIMVLKNDRLSIRSGHGRKPLLAPLLGLKAVDGQPVQVAGHNYAAGVYLTISPKSKLRYLWNWSIPRETEEFIREVKEKL